MAALVGSPHPFGAQLGIVGTASASPCGCSTSLSLGEERQREVGGKVAHHKGEDGHQDQVQQGEPALHRLDLHRAAAAPPPGQHAAAAAVPSSCKTAYHLPAAAGKPRAQGMVCRAAGKLNEATVLPQRPAITAAPGAAESPCCIAVARVQRCSPSTACVSLPSLPCPAPPAALLSSHSAPPHLLRARPATLTVPLQLVQPLLYLCLVKLRSAQLILEHRPRPCRQCRRHIQHLECLAGAAI